MDKISRMKEIIPLLNAAVKPIIRSQEKLCQIESMMLFMTELILLEDASGNCYVQQSHASGGL